MVDDLYIKNAYRDAYDKIVPSEECVKRVIYKSSSEKNISGTTNEIMKALMLVLQPVAVVAVIMILTVGIVVPAVAKEVPAIYNIIAEYVPQLTDFILAEKLTSTSEDIVMQVEAIKVDGQNAEIVVSFSDKVGNKENRINGEVDLYESYNIQSYGAVSNISGCSYLMYNQATDKAYFKIQATSFDEFDKSKIVFNVHKLLTNIQKETKLISVEDIVKNPKKKDVLLNGIGGLADIGYKYGDSYKVLDLMEVTEDMADKLTVTGIAYDEGYLKLQVCRGIITDADRHLRPFIKYADGTNVTGVNISNVSWKEEVKGKKYVFDEFMINIDEVMLDNLLLYGEFVIIDNSVNGNWEVTVNLD